MRRVLVLLVVGRGVARADDAPTSLHDGDDESVLIRSENEPLLHLDGVSLPYTTGLGAVPDVHERQVIDLGKRTWVELEGTSWSTVLDVEQFGWSTGMRVAHDFGWFTVAVGASLNHVDSRHGNGSYYDVGVTIGKAKKLSRWRTVWIALTLGRRHWLGLEPPAGERDVDQAMLGLGMTFK